MDDRVGCVPEERGWVGHVWSYIWLAYSGFYFIEPILRRDRFYWLTSACGYALFLAVYVWLNRATRYRTQLLLVLALFVVGVLNYPWNTGSSSFFIYAAGFLPFFLESAAWALGLMLLDCAVLLAEGSWLIYHPIWKGEFNNPINLGISVFFVLVVGISNLVVAQKKRADGKLHQAEREITALAAVAERERIARDLHDVLGHTLSVIVLKAELAGRLMDRDPLRARAEIGDVEQTARAALSEVREAIGGIRAGGLAAEMVAARRALDAAGVIVTMEEAERVQTLGVEAQTVLALTLREAVTNIVRHAGATQCRVILSSESGRCAMLVEDDGTHMILREGNGLRGMRERVERIGGRFSLQVGQGTEIRVEIPVWAQA